MSQRTQHKSGIITTDNIQRSTPTPTPTPSSPTHERRQGTFLLIAAALGKKQRDATLHFTITALFFFSLILLCLASSCRHRSAPTLVVILNVIPPCYSHTIFKHPHMGTRARPAQDINAAFRSHEQQKYKF